MIDTFIGCSLACPKCAHLCYRMYAFQKTYFQYFTGSRHSTIRPQLVDFVMKTLLHNFFIFFPDTIVYYNFVFSSPLSSISLEIKTNYFKLLFILSKISIYSKTHSKIQEHSSLHMYIHLNTILEFLNKTWLQTTIQVNSQNCSLAWKYWDWLELHSYGILDFSKLKMEVK